MPIQRIEKTRKNSEEVNFFHHKWCAICQKYTVHDDGKCIVCKGVEK